MIKQMKDDDVERVARAIHRERQAAGYSGQAAWEHEPHEMHALYMRTARAALSAMPLHELLHEALEALTPFASDADLWSGPDRLTLVEPAPGYSDALNVGDLRRARAAADKIRAAMGGE